eukprot:GHVL01010919.1.p1 GENE.GHVL01010919.1~~GHVL01010919.1.p1  ORF type:complete len:181 (+),score=18.69 GHVL01010919.1:44-586(+)
MIACYIFIYVLISVIAYTSALKSSTGCECIGDCVPKGNPAIISICNVQKSECGRSGCVCGGEPPWTNEMPWDVCSISPLKSQPSQCPPPSEFCSTKNKSVPDRCELPTLFFEFELDASGCAINPCYCLPPLPPCPLTIPAGCYQICEPCELSLVLAKYWFPDELNSNGCPTEPCLCVPGI